MTDIDRQAYTIPNHPVGKDLKRADVRSQAKQSSEVKEHHCGIQALGDLSSQRSRAQN